jgi:hypothetical protein
MGPVEHMLPLQVSLHSQPFPPDFPKSSSQSSHPATQAQLPLSQVALGPQAGEQLEPPSPPPPPSSEHPQETTREMARQTESIGRLWDMDFSWA